MLGPFFEGSVCAVPVKAEHDPKLGSVVPPDVKGTTELIHENPYQSHPKTIGAQRINAFSDSDPIVGNPKPEPAFGKMLQCDLYFSTFLLWKGVAEAVGDKLRDNEAQRDCSV